MLFVIFSFAHSRVCGGFAMALKNCPACNKEVSENATTCVGCGHPIKAPQASGCSLAISSVIIIILCYFLFSWLAPKLGLS